jgi:hypothetical protein
MLKCFINLLGQFCCWASFFLGEGTSLPAGKGRDEAMLKHPQILCLYLHLLIFACSRKQREFKPNTQL